MLTKFYHGLTVLVCLFITISSCKNSSSPPIKEEDRVKVRFSRFEEDLFNRDEKDVPFIVKLREKHGSFTDLVLKRVIMLKADNDSVLASEVALYTSDKYIKEVAHDVSVAFKDTRNLQEELNEAFSRFHQYFPSKIIPDIKTFIAPFNLSTLADDSIFGIGLDMYLGSDYKYYETAGLPLYKIRKLRKEYIVRDAMDGWLRSDYDSTGASYDMLSNMISEGKILYALDKLLPEEEDTIKYGYTQSQLDWCNDNEEHLWQFFISQKLLYRKNTGEFIKYINDAATTSGFPPEAPSRLGVFVGWQIVKAYMNKNSNVTLQQLMEMKNAEQILINSGYKPKK
jgi:hypothetical protein